MPSEIELTIVATRRPELLATTLASFHARMLRNFRVARVSINIDPLWGDDAAEAACVAAIRQHYPDAIVYRPEKPGYGAAVARLWAASRADFIFHLKDDWTLADDIDPSVLELFGDPTVAEVSLMCKEKNWDTSRRGVFHQTRAKLRVLGWSLPVFRTVPVFTVSPSFLRGDFARRWAELMDVSLDPEKQARPGLNPALAKYVAPFRNRIFSGRNTSNIAVDIGRAWRDGKGIEKTVASGGSVWSAPAGTDLGNP